MPGLKRASIRRSRWSQKNVQVLIQTTTEVYSLNNESIIIIEDSCTGRLKIFRHKSLNSLKNCQHSVFAYCFRKFQKSSSSGSWKWSYGYKCYEKCSFLEGGVTYDYTINGRKNQLKLPNNSVKRETKSRLPRNWGLRMSSTGGGSCEVNILNS